MMKIKEDVVIDATNDLESTHVEWMSCRFDINSIIFFLKGNMFVCVCVLE